MIINIPQEDEAEANELGQYIPLHYHYQMLTDVARVTAFRKAIEHVVICEMLHSALLREKQVQVMAAFRDAHYARFGTTPRMQPEATLLAVQPVWQSYVF